MGKKRCWFGFVKRLFNFEPKSKAEKKLKRWRCVFTRFKFRQYPEIASTPHEKTLSEATEEQRKHVLAVAIATAVAAEAAVAAANAAVEVVRLTHAPPQFGTLARNSVLRIQCAYRGHLARKALNGLKGVVKLQAVIRGEIARRRMIAKLKFIKSLTMKHSRVFQLRDENRYVSEKRQIMIFPEIELECSKHKNWDRRLVSKEDMEMSWLKKQEAIVKRDRMKKYSFSHRERRSDQIRVRNESEQDSSEGLNSPSSLPRRSFGDFMQKSIKDDNSLPDSPIFPSYMAATHSAKAKVRSLSTPKQRLMSHDTCSGHHSPYNLRLSSWTSFNSEITRTEKKSGMSHQKGIH